MDHRPEGHVNYTVCQAQTGWWDVSESGFRKPIASFNSKDDAMDYAQRLAETKQSAEIEVKD